MAFERRSTVASLVAISVAWLIASAGTRAQDVPPPPRLPAQEPSGGPAPGQPAVPSPTTPPGASTSLSREEQLEARVRQLEAIVNQLQYQMTNSSVMAPAAGATLAPGGDASAGVGAPEALGGTGGQTGGSRTGPGVPGQSFPPVPNVQPRFQVPATLDNRPGHVRFGPGFEIASDDEEFIMQFHNLTQFDFRGYLEGNQYPVHDGFGIPRQWWMFSGHITKEIGYFTSLANGFDTITLLDVFVDFNYDKRLQFRAGRFKTPFTYEFFIEPIQGLITPERSLFFNNFGQNRDQGIMPYGQLFDADNGVSRVQYAAGLFNATRNSYAPTQDGKWFSGFVNFHPFGGWEGSIFENFNVGGSVFTGNNSQPAVPSTFRTVQATTGNSAFGIPFLTLANNTMQSGPMAFWDLHAAWFYQQLALVSEWQSGFQDYALNTNQATRSMHTRVPVQSFYVLAGYLLTGETRSQYGVVKPFRPFSLRPGEFGPGAWEIFGRYNYLDIGDQIFSNGLASTEGNANRVWMTDVGVIWHLNQYVKMFFDWNHAEFNNGVTYNTTNNVPKGATQSTSNTLWWRLQLFF
jgi:phosphate-selective porin OprO/OprP